MCKVLQVGIREVIIGAASLILAAIVGVVGDQTLHVVWASSEIPAIEQRLSALEEANRQQAISMTGFSVQLQSLNTEIREYHDEEIMLLNSALGEARVNAKAARKAVMDNKAIYGKAGQE